MCHLNLVSAQHGEPFLGTLLLGTANGSTKTGDMFMMMGAEYGLGKMNKEPSFK